MAIKIAHSSIDENGKIAGGAAGDQTKKEVCIRDWYAKSWGYVIRFKDPAMREKAAKFMEQLAKNDNVGYDQNQRNTLIKYAEEVNWDASKIMKKCECDCSSAVTAACIAAGVPKSALYSTNACTTRTLRPKLVATGLVEVFSTSDYTNSDRKALRGDIYIKEGSHVIMCIENGIDSTKQTIHTPTSTPTSSSTKEPTLKVESNVRAIQTWLNTYYKCGLVVDGAYGPKTKKALVKAVQTEFGVTADGEFGPKSKAAAKVIKKGSRGILVTLWQCFLVLNRYNPNGIDGIFGGGCDTATRKFQRDAHISADGQPGPNTWYAALH